MCVCESTKHVSGEVYVTRLRGEYFSKLFTDNFVNFYVVFYFGTNVVLTGYASYNVRLLFMYFILFIAKKEINVPTCTSV